MNSCSGAGTKVDDLRTLFSALCRQLVATEEFVALSESFRAFSTDAERTRFSYNLLRELEKFPKLRAKRKNDSLSVECRKNGNALFAQRKDEDAIRMFSKSAALAAPTTSSVALGLAYANRSAVSIEAKRYVDCLKDIHRAFAHNYPEDLKPKLIERLNRADSHHQQQQEATKDEDVNKYYIDLPSLDSTVEANVSIECANPCVEINSNETLGRHVLTTKDIHPGDVIAIEQPFITVLLSDCYLTHCYHCLGVCSIMIPCLCCVEVMFCSEECRTASWDVYHRYECPILSTLISLNVGKLTLLALKVVLCAKNKLAALMEKGSIQLDPSDVYKSARYEEIHNLIANTEKRSDADLFERSFTAAVLLKFLEDETQFFDDVCASSSQSEFLVDKMDEMKYLVGGLLLLHLQTAPSNMHEISELFNKKRDEFKSVEIGAGAYSFLSMLNHDCSPNVVRNCYGTTIVLRALRCIRKGEQIFDNYGYHHAIMPLEERQQCLQQQYHFTCICNACKSNWPPYLSLKTIEVKDLFEPSEKELRALKNGDRLVARSMVERLRSNARILETYVVKDGVKVPCKNFYENQEIMKHCFAIFGNKRTSL